MRAITASDHAWRSSELSRSDVEIAIDVGELTAAAVALCEEGLDAVNVTAEQLPLGAAETGIEQLRMELMHGRGFAIVTGLPATTISQQANEYLFWRIGLALGVAESQSVMGDRLGHVRSIVEQDPNARAYRRNERLSPHSDPADLLSFYCLHPASEGGENHFVSSLAILDEMQRQGEHEIIERLTRGYRYHRFGEQVPGQEDITPYLMPVFSERDGLISCRYLRQYIEMANVEDPEGCPLDDIDRAALDRFEELAVDESIAMRFKLAAGEAVFANNYTVLHARTAFFDPPGEPKRHLLRLWLSTVPPRPVVPETCMYPGGAGIPHQPGRTPSYETSVETQ